MPTRTRPPRPPEARAARRAAFALVLVLAWLTATPVLARGWIASRAQERGEVAPEAERFASPREIGRALYAFVAGQAGARERVAGVFDLRDVPAAQRAAEGLWLVESRLVPILDRVLLLSPDGTPFEDELDVMGRSTSSWSGHPPGRPDLPVRLGFTRVGDGDWRIDRETRAGLETLWRAVQGQPFLESLRQKPLSPAEFVRRMVPDRLEQGGFLLLGYQWLGLVLLVLLGIVVERVLLFALRPLLRRVTRGEGSLYDELLGDFERPVGWVLATLVFLAGLPALDIEPRYRGTLELAASVVLAVGGVWAAYRLVDVAAWHLERRAGSTENRFDDMLVPLIRRTLKVLVVIVGVVFVASRLTADLWGVFAGLSIGSLALGFAAKDSVENLFGTFTVLLDNPFKLGDFVTVGGHTGTIEQVGFRSTRVRTVEDTLVTMPNSRFIASDIVNFSQRRRRRVELVLGATYDTPPETLEAFCEGLRELVRRHPWTYKQDYHAWLESFGAHSLDVKLICYLECLDFATFQRERHRLNLDVLRLAAELEVEFAFPTRTLHSAPSTPVPRTRTPSDLEAAVAAGRRAGLELGRRTLEPLGEGRPAPVRFVEGDPDAQGPLPPRP